MKRLLQRRPTALIALVGAAALLVLAIPRTVSAIKFELTTPVFDNRAATNVSKEQLLMVTVRLRSALDWVNEPETWSRLGQTYLAIAARESAEDRKLDLYYQAEDSFSNAVAISPLDPYYWFSLTSARLMTGGKEDGSAAQSLKMSLITGPHERALAAPQIKYASILWDQLDTDTQATINDKIRWAVTLDRESLLQAAKTDIRSMERIILALSAGNIVEFTRFINELNNSN